MQICPCFKESLYKKFKHYKKSLRTSSTSLPFVFRTSALVLLVIQVYLSTLKLEVQTQICCCLLEVCVLIFHKYVIAPKTFYYLHFIIKGKTLPVLPTIVPFFGHHLPPLYLSKSWTAFDACVFAFHLSTVKKKSLFLITTKMFQMSFPFPGP